MVCPGSPDVNEECKLKFVEVLVGHDEEFKVHWFLSASFALVYPSGGAFGVIGNNGFQFLVLYRFPYYLIYAERRLPQSESYGCVDEKEMRWTKKGSITEMEEALFCQTQ